MYKLESRVCHEIILMHAQKKRKDNKSKKKIKNGLILLKYYSYTEYNMTVCKCL